MLSSSPVPQPGLPSFVTNSGIPTAFTQCEQQTSPDMNKHVKAKNNLIINDLQYKKDIAPVGSVNNR